MAVTLTAQQLLDAAPVIPDGQAARLLQVGTALVQRAAPDAPDAIQDEAVIRVAGWLGESPEGAPVRSLGDGVTLAPAPRGGRSAMRASGALALLAPWRDIQLGIADEDGLERADPVIAITRGELRSVLVSFDAALPVGGIMAGTPIVEITPSTLASVSNPSASGRSVTAMVDALEAGDGVMRVTCGTSTGERIVSRIELLVAPA